MRIGGFLKGAIRGTSMARAGQLQGRVDRRKMELADQDAALERARYERQVQRENRAAEKDAIRLDLERRRVAAQEKNADTAAKRAARSSSGRGGSTPQWKAIQDRAQHYQKQGDPPHIAALRARADTGGKLTEDDVYMIEVYERRKAREKKASQTPPTAPAPRRGGQVSY